MALKLAGRVAAITGGTAGVGRGIADAYLAEGASVALMAPDQRQCDQMLLELGAGDRATFRTGAATSQADVEGFVDAAVKHYGKIDILVNNPGGTTGLRPLVDLTDEEWDLVMRSNLYSTFWAMRRALKAMIGQRWGRIINVSAVDGQPAHAEPSAATAAEYGINGLTRSVAREVGDAGVTVNSLCPGLVVDASGATAAGAATGTGTTFGGAPAQRPNTMQQVGAIAVLLASDAGAAITGALIRIDGGTAHY